MKLLNNKLILTILLLSITSLSNAQKKLIVNGEIKNYPFDKLFVRGEIPNSSNFFDDTIKVINDKFNYKRSIQGGVNYTFVAENMMSKFILFLADEDVFINVKYANINNPTVTGSKAYDDFKELTLKYYDSISNISKLTSQSYMGEKSEKDIAKKESKQAENNFLLAITTDKELRNNLAVSYYVSKNIDFTNYNFAEKIISNLSKTHRNGIYYNDMSIVLKRAKGVVVGAKVYNFKLNDINEKPYSLSDFRGKYVLIEFSASWCGWCKKEIPYIKKVYEYCKNKDLVIITINLDTDREDWIKESKEVPWLTLSDLNAYKSDITKKYNVKGIPLLFLIDKNGKLISRDLRGIELVNYIKKLL